QINEFASHIQIPKFNYQTAFASPWATAWNYIGSRPIRQASNGQNRRQSCSDTRAAEARPQPSAKHRRFTAGSKSNRSPAGSYPSDPMDSSAPHEASALKGTERTTKQPSRLERRQLRSTTRTQ